VGKTARFLVSGALLGWLARRTDWSQIADAFGHLRLDLWLGALGLYLLTQLVSAVRWQMLARPLELHNPWPQFLRFYFVGMYFNLLLPTSVGGDVVRAWYLDGGRGRRFAAFLSVLVDRCSGLLVLLALACVAVFLCPVPLERWIVATVWGTAGCAVLGLAALPFLLRSTNRFARSKRLLGGFRVYLGKPGLVLGSAGLSLFVQAGNVVLVWLIGRAIGAPVPGSYYWILVPMVSLVTLLPISMGIREGSMVLFLKPLGVNEGTAMSLAFLWFCVFTAAGLCGAGVYLFGNLSRPGEGPHDELIHSGSDQGRAGQSKAAA
jgi:uncharacterized membrane protein YbhN (UPF0104 family)